MVKFGYDRRQVVLMCFPVRLLSFLHGMMTFIMSWLLFFAREYLSLFWLGGGFVADSRLLLGLADFIGIWGGAFGAYGAWSNSVEWNKRFIWYQFYRWVTLVICMIFDVPAIAYCEEWLTNLHERMNENGFSPTLFNIAFEGRCQSVRTLYYSTGFFFVIFLFYLGYTSLKYEVLLKEMPKPQVLTDLISYLREDYGSVQKKESFDVHDDDQDRRGPGGPGGKGPNRGPSSSFTGYSGYLNNQNQMNPNNLRRGSTVVRQLSVASGMNVSGGSVSLRDFRDPNINAMGPPIMNNNNMPNPMMSNMNGPLPEPQLGPPINVTSSEAQQLGTVPALPGGPQNQNNNTGTGTSTATVDDLKSQILNPTASKTMSQSLAPMGTSQIGGPYRLPSPPDDTGDGVANIVPMSSPTETQQ